MNEEKDRFGEFISLLERAREDVYFAAKDCELLEKLRQRLAMAEQRPLPDRSLNCPQCGIAFQDSSVLDRAVKLCPQCGGTWVGAAAMQELLHRLEAKKLEPPRRNSPLRYVWAPSERPTP